MNPRMKLIFTVSLLLNIVFVGTAAGMLYRFAQERIDIPGDMTPEARSFMARTFQQGREQIRPMIDKVKKERKDVENVIKAEPFDIKAYEKTTGVLLDTRNDISRKRAEIMGEALADLPQKDRDKFARKIIDGLEGRRPHGGGYHHKMMMEKYGKGRDMKGEEKPNKED